MSAKRFWAGHAISAKRAALSFGELDDENATSVVLIYDEDRTERWTRHRIARTIVSITSMPGASGAPIFVALSNDGEVHFIDDAVRVEQIPGAGTGGDSGLGQGSMSFIRYAADRLYACGNASQVYERTPPGKWMQICSAKSAGVRLNSFQSVAARGPREVYVCGYSDVTYFESGAEVEAELARLEREGPMDEYIRLMNEVDVVEHYAQGCLFFFDGKGWRAAKLPNEQHMNDVGILDARKVVCAGGRGTLVFGGDPAAMNAVSGLTEELRALRVGGEAHYVLGDNHLLVLDETMSVATKLALPMKKPNLFDVTDDTIWYFDHDGVARHRDGAWEILEVPSSVLS